MNQDVTIAQLQQYLEELGAPSAVQPDSDALLTIVPSKHGTHTLAITLDTDRQVVKLTAGRLLTVPRERFAVAAQLAVHVSYHLLLGAFTIDLTDGELAFELAIPYRGVGISQEQLTQCILATTWTLTGHLPQFYRVCWTDLAIDDLVGLPVTSPLMELREALREQDGPGATSA